MKLISLNTHSLVEKEWEKKCRLFVETVSRETADVVAMQEVNQTIAAALVETAILEETGYFSCKEDVAIREDNYIWKFVQNWKRLNPGKHCYWTWLPMKIGYSKYDEGLAIFTTHPILETKQFYITEEEDYHNWKVRMALGAFIEVDGERQWFYSVHTGWWEDEMDPFVVQWERIERQVKSDFPVWIMGDFNNPSHVRGQGYDYVKQSGWFDCYLLAKQKDDGITVETNIDGWEQREKVTGMRIDFIWCREVRMIQESRVIMNGKRDPIVSDHFGILIVENRKN